MNDQILLDNYLLLLKSTVEVYVHGTLESSNNDVRELLFGCLNDTITMQANTYDEMVNQGWYVVENVQNKDISKVLNKVNSN